MIIPYRVDVPQRRHPVANYVILGLMFLVFYVPSGSMLERLIERFAIHDLTFSDLAAHMWLHLDFRHLIGNMIFLCVFGNAVCAKIGNIAYPVIYVAMGLVAAVFHLLFSDGAAVGASGAINGVIGLYLVFYPLNDVHCFWLFWLRAGTYAVSSFWMIGLWFLFDIWGALGGGGGVAYVAHIGGFLGGVATGVLLLQTGMVGMEQCEKSFLSVMGWGDEKKRALQKRNIAGDRGQFPDMIAPWEQASPKTAPVISSSDTGFFRVGCLCSKTLKIPRTYSGKSVACPHCGAVFTVRASKNK